ncbi:class I SAM-dependent methyltransferase [Fulvivirgaceae bacterium BMA12]|uniref:Class I SAM-dependent methyltransferase n=1 Tax=Agaribacillus aureus TaxID=3051825 RepID=A0ABT8L6X3_9BACT|nr:class I SAM-dependent methyltransferase [Fulvivirgaceae bacterium BMA12]
MKNQVINSWDINAKEWINLIENEGILSRKVTNPAILDTIVKYSPDKILDFGCGEGWLTRSLAAKGFKAYGADAIAALVSYAQEKGSEKYFQLSYQEVISGVAIPFAPFDAMVFNFCLYEKEETVALLNQVRASLRKHGLVFIQTLHPFAMVKSGLPYKSTWMDDAWKGLKGGFKAPHRWYFRTFESWLEDFKASGLQLLSMVEPMPTDDLLPTSVIFVLNKNSNDER